MTDRVGSVSGADVRPAEIASDQAGRQEIPFEQIHDAIRGAFDAPFYLRGFPPTEEPPADPVTHYITVGWAEGRDPNEEFSTAFYLEANPDVADSKLNPFYHFLTQGSREQRHPKPPKGRERPHPGRGPLGEFLSEFERFTSPSAMMEEPDYALCADRRPAVKAIAYYLPQFHPIPENDAWWGSGFTEWRNVVRGQPRFKGHYQPRLPRELGFYDLRLTETMREQIRLAQAFGLHGFCFYYYSFNGRRLLSGPLEAFLADETLEFPFALMWANENWTRTWDGHDNEVLMSQDYRLEDEPAFLADLARHFRDPRYIRIGDRPLFFIYRPGIIPEATATLRRWRGILERDHGLNPLLYMAQGFGDSDPSAFGLDGAIEFPPHKIVSNLPPIDAQLEVLDPGFTGHVVAYDDVMAASIGEAPPGYPLIKCVAPSWDNEARRPGRGMVLHGSTPEKYERWLRKAVQFAAAHPTHGESFVAVNAWNEWAESAYLEPDIHFGAAYLNATARALAGGAGAGSLIRGKVLLVGHDAFLHGAQVLLKNLAEMLAARFGLELHILICGEGPLLEDYRRIAPCTVVPKGDQAALEALLSTLRLQRYRFAITNTTVAGWTVPALKRAGFHVASLVHELRLLIEDYGLQADARAIATESDVTVFGAEMIRSQFQEVAGTPEGIVLIRPQGLYSTKNLVSDRIASPVRGIYGIPSDALLVVNVAYADSRKGFDIFLHIAQTICAEMTEAYFIWVGETTADISRWLLPDIARAGMSDRIFVTGFANDFEQYLAAADLFLLTSREDPFPSVVLDAFAAGLPVIGFDGCTGCADLIRRHGVLIERGDVAAALAAVRAFADGSAAESADAAAARRCAMREEFRFDDYCFFLLRTWDPGLASVSVVVPNYNYAHYLPERLSSVFGQTCPVFETIVLDDASVDDSLAVIRRIAEDAKRHVQVLANPMNSGSVFHQWVKGAYLARGDYLWIAEADDVADKRFIEVMAGKMQAAGASLGFCDSWQIGTDGQVIGPSYKSYVNQIEAHVFNSSFLMEGPEFLRRFLSVKNVILNVSGVMWRRDALVQALEAVGEELFELKVAGDWRLYAEVCKAGGSVYYESMPLNGHRRHVSSVTSSLAAQRHYDEILAMQHFAAGTEVLEDPVLLARAAHLAEVKRVLQLADADQPA